MKQAVTRVEDKEYDLFQLRRLMLYVCSYMLLMITMAFHIRFRAAG